MPGQSPVSTGERQPDAFRLRTQRCGHGVEAVCEVWREAAGWRMRLAMSDAGVKWDAQVATEGERDQTVNAWRDALIARGWV